MTALMPLSPIAFPPRERSRRGSGDACPSPLDLLRPGHFELRLPPLTPQVKSSVLALGRALRASNREIDDFGFLRVKDCVLSRAVISRYLGHEVPEYATYGLHPDATYSLFRDPQELRKATPSFTQCPLLIQHRAVTADDIDPNLVIGATGEARWQGDSVIADIVIWRAEAAQEVLNGNREALSAGYSYTYDPTPGTWKGRAYDGVMRAIRCQHVALVDEPRVPGAVVADALPLSLRQWRR